MKLEEIRELIALMKENQIAEIDLEQDGERLRVVATQSPVVTRMVAEPAQVVEVSPAAAAIPVAEEPPAAPDGETIDCPIVGTFYRAPSPESPSYVEEGDDFDEETVLCIVEAMKVMNEIKAEKKGKILEILVENGQPVEFGQPLYRVALTE